MISLHSFVVVDLIEPIEVVVDDREVKEEEEIQHIVVQLLQLLHAVVVTQSMQTSSSRSPRQQSPRQVPANRVSGPASKLSS